MLKYVTVPIFSLALFALPATSQNTALGNVPQVERRLGIPAGALNNASSLTPQQQNERAAFARAVAERHAQLRLDTEKLVALTAELKQHVDKAGANILSMDVIKKAKEIQKLAKSVQDKMRNAY
jgi:hypothetical protein